MSGCYLLADLRDPDIVLAGVRDFLDVTRLAALLLVAILHFIPDADDPALVVAYRNALPPGSSLVLSHRTGDFHPAEVAVRLRQRDRTAGTAPPPGARRGFAGGASRR